MSQTGENTGIRVVNAIPDGTDRISELLGKRQGFAHQTGTAWAEGGVEAFKVTGLIEELFQIRTIAEPSCRNIPD